MRKIENFGLDIFLVSTWSNLLPDMIHVLLKMKKTIYFGYFWCSQDVYFKLWPFKDKMYAHVRPMGRSLIYLS